MRKSEIIRKAASIAFAIFLTLSGSAMVWAICNGSPISYCDSLGNSACSKTFFVQKSNDNPFVGTCKNYIYVGSCDTNREGCDTCVCRPEKYAQGNECFCLPSRARRLSPISN